MGDGYWRMAFGSHRKQLFELSNVAEDTAPKHMACPDCNARCDFIDLIIHLNDNHEYSFPKTADKLEIAKPYDDSSVSWLQRRKDSYKN